MKQFIKDWWANRAIKREAWIYAKIHSEKDRTRQDVDACNRGAYDEIASDRGVKDRRRQYYYTKMKELGGKF